MMRVLRNDGAIFYNHKWRVQDGLLQDRSDIVAGFPVRQIIIWQRAGGINFNPGYFLPNYEVIYLICKPRVQAGEESERYRVRLAADTAGIQEPAPRAVSGGTGAALHGVNHRPDRAGPVHGIGNDGNRRERC